MKKTSKISIISALVSLGLVLGSATPATSAEPCTFPDGGAGVDAAGCDFSGRDLFNSVFTGANFSNTNFTGARSNYAYWSDVNFTGANLTDSIFYGTDFANSGFHGANLTGANIAGSNVPGTDFSTATLTGITSGGLTGTPILPVGWISSGGYLIGPGANLQGANLSGVDLTGVDLTGANLNGVRSGGVLGTPVALPANYGLFGGYLIGPGVDLAGAKLDGLSIWFADLTNVNLSGASINQTAFNNTTSFEGVRSGGLVGTVQNINGARLIDGYIVTAKADLSGADLRGSNLSELDLQDVNLTDADLTGANLFNSYLVGATLVNTNFTLANLDGANLSTNEILFNVFNGAGLAGTSFQGATVFASEFYNTDVIGTDFSSAVLTSTRSGDLFGTPAALPSDIQIVDGEFTRVFTQSLSPVIEGVGQTGKTVTANTLETPDGATVAYQWLRNGEPIQGANTRTYLITAKDVSNQLTVRTTLSKRSILTLVETSNPFAVAKADIVPGPVSISGTLIPGRTIKAVVRPWVNAVGVKFKYQWYQNGVAIKFATASTYKLRISDSKKNISVIVLQSLDGYNSASKQSGKKKIS